MTNYELTSIVLSAVSACIAIASLILSVWVNRKRLVLQARADDRDRDLAVLTRTLSELQVKRELRESKQAELSTVTVLDAQVLIQTRATAGLKLKNVGVVTARNVMATVFDAAGRYDITSQLTTTPIETSRLTPEQIVNFDLSIAQVRGGEITVNLVWEDDQGKNSGSVQLSVIDRGWHRVG